MIAIWLSSTKSIILLVLILQVVVIEELYCNLFYCNSLRFFRILNDVFIPPGNQGNSYLQGTRFGLDLVWYRDIGLLKSLYVHTDIYNQ